MDATTARIPAKIQNLLDYAVERGMIVEPVDERKGRFCWTLRSNQTLDCDRIWIFWDGPGPNGGRTGIKLYRPFARRQPSRVTNLTFQRARSWVRILSGTVVA